MLSTWHWVSLSHDRQFTWFLKTNSERTEQWNKTVPLFKYLIYTYCIVPKINIVSKLFLNLMVYDWSQCSLTIEEKRANIFVKFQIIIELVLISRIHSKIAFDIDNEKKEIKLGINTRIDETEFIILWSAMRRVLLH